MNSSNLDLTLTIAMAMVTCNGNGNDNNLPFDLGHSFFYGYNLSGIHGQGDGGLEGPHGPVPAH